MVKEGQIVETNQPLMYINDVRFSSTYRENRSQLLAFQLKIQCLKAELQNKPLKLSPNLIKEIPDLIRSERSLYHSRQNELKSLKHKRSLLIKEIRMLKPLVKQGAASEVEVLRLRQRLHETNNIINRFRSTALLHLNEAKNKYDRLKESNVALKDRLERTVVRSPVKGIVKQIFVSTIGGVVKSGMPLMEIVPLNDTLLIEARVNPKDIGFLHAGQKATVKITAYDYSIYGGFPGTVEYISADTSTDRQGKSFYEIRIRTDRNYLKKNGTKYSIIPGMQASVEILTGRKSVLDYLLKPILKGKNNAMKER